MRHTAAPLPPSITHLDEFAMRRCTTAAATGWAPYPRPSGWDDAPNVIRMVDSLWKLASSSSMEAITGTIFTEHSQCRWVWKENTSSQTPLPWAVFHYLFIMHSGNSAAECFRKQTSQFLQTHEKLFSVHEVEKKGSVLRRVALTKDNNNVIPLHMYVLINR